MRRQATFVVLLSCLLVWGSVSGAGMVLPLTLRQMAEDAGRIFVGRCTAISEELDEAGVPATYIRFQVSEGLKGVQDGDSLLVKQYGRRPAPLRVREGERVVLPFPAHGAATIAAAPGEEALLFLYPESEAGFTSPVGLGQGRFLIRESGGTREAAPAREAIPALSLPSSGPNDLEELVAEIRGILRED